MKKLIYILVPAVLLVASCASYRYHTTKVESTDFSNYRTYGWLPPVDSLSKSYFNNDIARTNILDAANRELEARGLTYSKENPDLLFRYIVIVNNKKRPVYGGHWGPWGMWGHNPWGWGYGWNRPVGEERYRASHLIIEARDRRTDSVIWQARGTGQLRNPEQATNELPEVVAGVLDEFPGNGDR